MHAIDNVSFRFLLVYHRIFNTTTVKTISIHTLVYEYTKTPVKPLFLLHITCY